VRPSRRSAAACLAALLLAAAPGAAWAQGAGDEQYEDPFGDTPVQSGGGGSAGGGSGSGGGDDGLSDTPQVPGGSQDGQSPGSPGSAGSEGTSGTQEQDATGTREEATAGRLPNTGSDPRIIGVLGVALALVGAGLRLRTVDPDLF